MHTYGGTAPRGWGRIVRFSVLSNFHDPAGGIVCHLPVHPIAEQVEQASAGIQIGIQVIAHRFRPVLTVCADYQSSVLFEPFPSTMKIHVRVHIHYITGLGHPVQHPEFSANKVTSAFTHRSCNRHWPVQAECARLGLTVGRHPSPAIVGVPCIGRSQTGQLASLIEPGINNERHVETRPVRIDKFCTIHPGPCIFRDHPEEIRLPAASLLPGIRWGLLKVPLHILQNTNGLPVLPQPAKSYILGVGNRCHSECDIVFRRATQSGRVALHLGNVRRGKIGETWDTARKALLDIPYSLKIRCRHSAILSS